MAKRSTTKTKRCDGWRGRGKRLRELRKIRGISQADTARAAGIKPNHLTRIESGFVALNNYTTRLAVARGYGLSIDAFDELVAGKIGAAEAAEMGSAS